MPRGANGAIEGLGFGSALRREVTPYGVHVSTVTYTYARTARTRARQSPAGRGHERASRFTLAVGGFGRASALSFRVWRNYNGSFEDLELGNRDGTPMREEAK